MTSFDANRRFGGTARLYGEEALHFFQQSHVVVIGIGGVGSWAAEGLARNGIGQITLIDLDNVAESNFNRQIHAVDGNIGKPKVKAMQERISAINPECRVNIIDDFLTPENVASLIPKNLCIILDCTDDVKAKTSLAVYCHRHQIPLGISGSAGGKIDPTRMKIADLAHAQGDRLLAKIRYLLRHDYDFPKAHATKKAARFGLDVVYSDEPVQKPVLSCNSQEGVASNLNCAGYGSSVTVTATFGFAMTQWALNQCLKSQSVEA